MEEAASVEDVASMLPVPALVLAYLVVVDLEVVENCLQLILVDDDDVAVAVAVVGEHDLWTN